MQDIQKIFDRIQESKKDQKEIMKAYRDALKNSRRHQEITEEIKIMRDKKKGIEEEIKEEFRSELDRLETLKADIENDQMLLSDAALSYVTSGKPVEIKDKNETRYEPVFTVKFKKAG
jgi:DNA repair exonuclease SbcCD ATPase subunit